MAATSTPTVTSFVDMCYGPQYQQRHPHTGTTYHSYVPALSTSDDKQRIDRMSFYFISIMRRLVLSQPQTTFCFIAFCHSKEYERIFDKIAFDAMWRRIIQKTTYHKEGGTVLVDNVYIQILSGVKRTPEAAIMFDLLVNGIKKRVYCYNGCTYLTNLQDMMSQQSELSRALRLKSLSAGLAEKIENICSDLGISQVYMFIDQYSHPLSRAALAASTEFFSLSFYSGWSPTAVHVTSRLSDFALKFSSLKELFDLKECPTFKGFIHDTTPEMEGTDFYPALLERCWKKGHNVYITPHDISTVVFPIMKFETVNVHPSDLCITVEEDAITGEQVFTVRQSKRKRIK